MLRPLAIVLQFLGGLGLSVFLAMAFTSLPNAMSRLTAVAARIEPADAIVVLGHGIRSDGTLTDLSLRATVEGIGLYRQRHAPLLVLAGFERAGGLTEARVRSSLARELGVPADAILQEDRGRTTREEAVRIGGLLAGGRILLVTDPLHMHRARSLFEQAGVVVLPAPTGDGGRLATRPHERVLLAWRLAREGVARLYYRLVGHL
jgi:uncharacterized SAM-binding protein YcdF (DUF218 family)